MSFFSLFKKQAPIVAISFDDMKLRYVVLSKNKKGISLDRYGTEILGETIIDHEGVIRDDALFVKKLKSLKSLIWKNAGQAQAVVVIPDRQAVCFHSHVPKVPLEHMEDVIVSHITTYCQTHNLLNFKEYICEYDIIQETEHGYDIHVTLVPERFVDHLVRLFKQSGISVPHIETAHHAVARSCLAIPQGQGYIAVMVGEKTTYVSLVHEDHLVNHRVVPTGTEKLLTCVTRQLRVSEKEAQVILSRHGISKTHPDTALLGHLYQVMMPVVYTINELIIEQGTRPYKKFGDRFSIETMLVYRAGVEIGGMVTWLSQELGIRAQGLDVWAGRSDHGQVLSQIPIEQTYSYAEALSLALVYLK